MIEFIAYLIVILILSPFVLAAIAGLAILALAILSPIAALIRFTSPD